MPKRASKYCTYPGCKNLAVAGSNSCQVHKTVSNWDGRPSASRRGYGSGWRRIRIRVLKEYGIPEEEWPLYDIDHNPPYNPEVEPDHNMYILIPRLHAEHSSKTVREDGGFGRNNSHG